MQIGKNVGKRSGKKIRTSLYSIKKAKLFLARIEPTIVRLSVSHREIPSGKTLKLFADGEETGKIFADQNSKYVLEYEFSAPVGSEVKLQAKSNLAVSETIKAKVKEGEGPDPVTDLTAKTAKY